MPEHLDYTDHLLHRLVGAFHDGRAEKKPFDVVAAVEIHRQVHNLPRGKGCPLDGIGGAVDAVGAVVPAVVREENLQERYAATVVGPGVTDPALRGVAGRAGGSVTAGAAACAGGIIARCSRKDPEFFLSVHVSNITSAHLFLPYRRSTSSTALRAPVTTPGSDWPGKMESPARKRLLYAVEGPLTPKSEVCA